MENKDQLRKKYFAIRKKNYFDIKSNFFDPLLKLIKKNYKKDKINISIYYPSSFEVDTLNLFKTIYTSRIKTYLPAITGNSSMQFYKWNNQEILQINKFGMLEPFITVNEIVPDVMLVPLLAFDYKKNRLGYGKGFYDQYLQKYLKKYNNILTIGIAFSFQKYHKLPVSINDVQLNYILTEKGIF